MNNVSWTNNQLNAIEARDMSLIVSAAAGSGKTAVLVERIVSIITNKQEPVDIDKLVVVTFSNAAAKEMKHRVTKRLSEIIKENKDSYIQKQISKLSTARISTVHSLCFDLIKENFYILDLPPDVKIGEQREIEILKQQSIIEVIEEEYSIGDIDFLRLSDLLSKGNDDKGLLDTISGLYNFLRSYPFYIEWLDEMAEEYSAASKPQYSKWGKVVLKDSFSKCKYIKEMLINALQTAKEDDSVYTAYSVGILADLDQINFILNAFAKEDWLKIREGMENISFNRLGQARKCENISVKEFVKGLRDKAKDELKDLAAKDLFCSYELFDTEMEFLLPLIKSLFSLIKKVDTKFLQAKLEQKLIDFSDLEHFTLKMLINKGVSGYSFTDVANTYSKGIYQVMVDEYQDTNQVQDMIFKALSENGKKLFMVGDVKQSIYGFRQAKPDIFLEKKKMYPLFSKGNKQGKIIMADNFRSRAEITTGINYIFSSIMSSEAGGIEYNNEECLNPSAVYPEYSGCGCEMVIIEDNSEEESLSSREREASFIAYTIKSMIQNKYMVNKKGELTPVKPEDFAILLRSTTGRAEIYQKALKTAGIDALVSLENGFLTTKEISSVIAFLKAIDNPLRDLDLATALMSPLFGFSATDISKISVENSKIPLYLRVVQNKDKNPKCNEFLKIYSKLRKDGAILNTTSLIYELYDATDAEAVFSMMKNGSIRVANLRLLTDYAKNFDISGYKGLSSFIRFISEIEETGGDLAPSALVSEQGDSVKIMSIHKSKGLEFPVVFLADSAKRFNTEDLKKSSLIHPELGFASMRQDTKLKVMYKTMALSSMRLAIKKENIDEEMRVLYVAMTRAKEKLIITSVIKNPQSKLEKLSKHIENKSAVSSGHINSCSSYSDWILSALLHHKDGVILRSLAGYETQQIYGNIGEFNIKLIETTVDEQILEQDITNTANNIQQNVIHIVDEIKERYNFAYANIAQTIVPTGMAISQIKKDKIEVSQDLFTSKPKFILDKGLTGAEKGSALHMFMQFAVFENAEQNLEKEIERMVSLGYISPKQGESLDLAKIKTFFDSELYQRIKKADKVLREYSIFADVDNSILGKYTDILPDNTKVAVQGIADCVIIEGENAVVIDYKTDYVKDEQPLLERYSIQLNLYKDLLSDFLGCKKITALIYSFQLNKIIEI